MKERKPEPCAQMMKNRRGHEQTVSRRPWVYRKKSSSGIGLRRKQVSASASPWPESERTPTPAPSLLVPGLALGSLEERACVLGTATSPLALAPALRARTRRATEPRWKRSLADGEGDDGGEAAALVARVATVEQDQRERSFSSLCQQSDSSSSEPSSGRKEESEGAAEEEGDGCGEGSAA